MSRSATVSPFLTAAVGLVFLCLTLSQVFAGGFSLGGCIKNGVGVAVSGVPVVLYRGADPLRTTSTNTSGLYVFNELEAGTYTVKPKLEGKIFTPQYRTYTLSATVENANFVLGEETGTNKICGVVKNLEGAPVAGVSVSLYQSDNLKQSTSTNAEGRYVFEALPAATYVVKPSQTGKVFQPAQRACTVPPSATEAHFTLKPAPSGLYLQGYLKTPAGAGMGGVSVCLYQGAEKKATTTTASTGKYYFADVPAGSYTVAPAKDGKVFEPLSRTVTVPPSASDVNFIGREVVVLSTISGVIKNGEGSAVAGVPVGLRQGGEPKASTTTDADGRYRFSNLAAGSYTVKPELSGKVFEPASRALKLPPTVENADFVIADAPVLSAIYGFVKTPAGAPLVGIAVGLTPVEAPKSVLTATTNADGRYNFTKVLPGTYTVKPTADNLVFDPATRTVTVPPGAGGVSFVGAPKPSPATLREGKVYPLTGTTTTQFTFSVFYTSPANRAPAAGYVIVDGKSYRMAKGEAGDNNFADGCKYIYKLFLGVGEHKFRFAFAPPEAATIFCPGPGETNWLSGPTVTGEGYALSGVVATAESRLQGVTITVTADGIEPIVTTTNAEGRYYATGLAPGRYTVTAAKAGYTFDPPSWTIEVPPTVINLNFRATVD